MISAGKLDRRVTLQMPTVSRGDLGGVEKTWADAATVWAQVRPLSGREATRAQQVQSMASVAVTIRYRTDIDTTARVVLDDGRTGSVTWIEEIGRREGLNLYCEIVNG